MSPSLRIYKTPHAALSREQLCPDTSLDIFLDLDARRHFWHIQYFQCNYAPRLTSHSIWTLLGPRVVSTGNFLRFTLSHGSLIPHTAPHSPFSCDIACGSSLRINDEYGNKNSKVSIYGGKHETYKTRQLVTITCSTPICTYFLDPHI